MPWFDHDVSLVSWGLRSQAVFSHGAHFTENHDEPRAASVLGGDQQAFAGTVITSTIPGLRLFFFGQFSVRHLRGGVTCPRDCVIT